MPLETATYIADLVATNPVSSDAVGQGDDHLRMIKSVLQATFPNMGGRVGRIVSGATGYTVLSTDNTAFIHVPTASGATVTHTFSLPALSSITAGFSVDLNVPGPLDYAILVATGGASIEGSASHTLLPQTGARVFYDGSQWRVQKYLVAPEGGYGYYLGSTLTVSGEATFKTNVSIAGGLQVGTAFGVGGASTFNAAASFSASVVMQGTMRVEGTSTMSGAVVMNTTLSVSGQAYFTTTMVTQGAAQIGGAFSVGGATTLAGTLSVSAATVLGDGLSVAGAATISGLATFSTNIRVEGTSTISGAAVFLTTTTGIGAASFRSSVSISATLEQSGLLNLISGQLKYPAVQSASADANTLDDYEEGTWTPVLTAATVGNLSVTYSNQIGVYTKVGNTVHCRGRVTTSAFTHTTASGECRITGLPFQPATCPVPTALYFSGVTKAGYTQFVFLAGTTVSYLALRACGTGIAAAVGNITDLPTGGTVDLVFDFTHTV